MGHQARLRDMTCLSYSFNQCDFICQGQVCSIGSRMFCRNSKHSFDVIFEITKQWILLFKRNNFLFVLWHRRTSWKDTDFKYSSGAWSRGVNFVSTSDGYEYFFPVTFSSDVNFLQFFCSTNRMSKRIKLSQKKYRSPTSFKRKNRKQTKLDPWTTRLPDSAVSLSLSDWNDTLASLRLSINFCFARV